MDDTGRVVHDVTFVENDLSRFSSESFLVVDFANVNSIEETKTLGLHLKVVGLLVVRREADHWCLHAFSHLQAPLLGPFQLVSEVLLEVCVEVGVVASTRNEDLDLSDGVAR